MSKEALYGRISACKQEIEQNQKEIVKLEAKIEEYEYIRAKVMRGADNLCDFCGYQSRKISDTKNRHQKVKFLDAYIEDMAGYLQGRDYYEVMDRFAAAGDRLWNKRGLALEQIDALRGEIYRLEEEIGMLEAQIREIERREEEARRAAEEARMAEIFRNMAQGGAVNV